MAANIAALSVTLDGKDLAAKINPRLISLSIVEKRGGEADQLDIVLHDHDGKLDIPKPGAVIRIKLGWKQGDDVTPGLVDKGSFRIDEAEWSGPPDIVTIRGRSADLADSLRVRKEKTHRDTTIGAIVEKVAKANGLTAKVESSLAGIAVTVLQQDGKSDMAFLRKLGRRHDAVATVKDGKLLFAPIGAGRTAGGKAIPPTTLVRSNVDRYAFRRVDRSNTAGVEARWHDQGSARRKTVKVAGDGKGKAKRLRKIYGSEADAKAAAQAEASRLKRGAAEFDVDLALGRPDLYPERAVTLKGFKAEPDAKSWLIAEATHALDGDGGLTTKLKLETA